MIWGTFRVSYNGGTFTRPTVEEPALGASTVEEPAPGAPTVEESSPGAPTVEEPASGVFSFEKLGPSLLKPALWVLKALGKTGLRSLDPGRFPLWVPNPVEPALRVPALSETALSVPP